MFVPRGKFIEQVAFRTPLASLIQTPAPKKPGFPLEVPSKFSLQKPSNGGVHLIVFLSTFGLQGYIKLPLKGSFIPYRHFRILLSQDENVKPIFLLS